MILRIVLSHFLTDLIFQPNNIARNKHKIISNIYHCLTHLIISIILTLDIFSLRLLKSLIIIIVIHGLIDFIKSILEKHLEYKKIFNKYDWIIFLIDQCLHIITIIIIISLLQPIKFVSFNQIWKSLLDNKVLLSFSAFLIIVFGGYHFTSKVCKMFKNEISKSKNTKNLSKAGGYIGCYERLLITIAVIMGKYEIIGFLIAAKSIIRHPEFKNHTVFTEYFIIGTFSSFTWATSFSLLYKFLLTQL
jgi:hypothetical protein